MAEEKKEKWLNWLALTTLIFSAAATLSSYYGGGNGSKAMMEQNLASDSWSFYQAKSIKQHTYEIQRDVLTVQSSGAPEASQAQYKEIIDRYASEAKRYDEEKKEIKAKAEKHEATKKHCQYLGGFFGIAVLYLQVGIMLAALGALLKKKPLWLVGLLPGSVGFYYFLQGMWASFHP